MDTLSSSLVTVAGWVSGPNKRGTIDIVWSSFFTIFLCTWTAICLNVPDPSESKHKNIYTRLKRMFLAIAYPELVFALAIGQYASARRSLKRFHDLGHTTWTLGHGFFANMGGILLKPIDNSPFVVNSYQLANLVEKDLVSFPRITAEEIWDKSKADTLAKVLMIFQAGYLMIQLLGRAILHLPISTLELSAGAIVFCTIGTFLCWLYKPSDVQKGIVMEVDLLTDVILSEAGGMPVLPYRHSYIDAAGQNSFSCIYDIMRLSNKPSSNRVSPLRYFPNDCINSVETHKAILILCFNVAYNTSHLFGWCFTFPTATEALLWKISSSMIIPPAILFWALEYEKPITSEKNVNMRNRHTISWKAILRIILIFFSTLARWYIIIESLISLRKMPVGVYES